jgi:hypothetical protein
VALRDGTGAEEVVETRVVGSRGMGRGRRERATAGPGDLLVTVTDTGFGRARWGIPANDQPGPEAPGTRGVLRLARGHIDVLGLAALRRQAD